jgi:hypothetical protein
VHAAVTKGLFFGALLVMLICRFSSFVTRDRDHLVQPVRRLFDLPFIRWVLPFQWLWRNLAWHQLSISAQPWHNIVRQPIHLWRSTKTGAAVYQICRALLALSLLVIVLASCRAPAPSR